MHDTRSTLVILTLMATTLTLSGCGEKTKETLGLSRRAPDAFAVVTRAPLELPPDYTLRPPIPGAERPQDTAPADSAAQALLGNTARPKKQSKAESVILNKSGANQAPADIRSVITIEQGEDTDDNTPIGRKLLGLGPLPKDSGVIDPVAEKKRLDQNKQVSPK